MNLHKTLMSLITPVFPELVWHKVDAGRSLYLTFDDGPDPIVTPQVLKILRKQNIPAAFFLQGQQLKQHQSRLEELQYGSQQIGNHGYTHHPIIGRSAEQIEREILETDRLLQDKLGQKTSLFRPPYGIFGPGLLRQVRKQNKQMILWSLLSNDFKWGSARVLTHLQKRLQPGDIVVFHDHEKSGEVLLQILPEFINFCKKEKFTFSRL